MRLLTIGAMQQQRNQITLPLLDIYPNSVTAYSLRLLSSTYAGACMRVRRSSDNAEQDIGFTGKVFDSASLLAFVGAGDGFVRTWYDQSGENNHAANTTNDDQPIIAESGVILEAIKTIQPSGVAGRHLEYTTPYVAAQAEVCVSTRSKLVAQGGIVYVVGSSFNPIRNVLIHYPNSVSIRINMFRGTGTTTSYPNIAINVGEYNSTIACLNRVNANIAVDALFGQYGDTDYNFSMNVVSRIGSNGINGDGTSFIKEVVHWNKFYTESELLAINNHIDAL